MNVQLNQQQLIDAFSTQHSHAPIMEIIDDIPIDLLKKYKEMI